MMLCKKCIRKLIKRRGRNITDRVMEKVLQQCIVDRYCCRLRVRLETRLAARGENIDALLALPT